MTFKLHLPLPVSQLFETCSQPAQRLCFGNLIVWKTELITGHQASLLLTLDVISDTVTRAGQFKIPSATSCWSTKLKKNDNCFQVSFTFTSAKMQENVIKGSSTASKSMFGINPSLLKGGTVVQTVIAVVITAMVVASTIATITLVSVGAGYSPPVARPDLATTYKRTPIVIDVLVNDYDPRGGNLTLSGIVVQPSHGSVN